MIPTGPQRFQFFRLSPSRRRDRMPGLLAVAQYRLLEMTRLRDCHYKNKRPGTVRCKERT